MHNNQVVVHYLFSPQPRCQLRYISMLGVILHARDLHFEILQLLDNKENNLEPVLTHCLVREDSTYTGLL